MSALKGISALSPLTFLPTQTLVPLQLLVRHHCDLQQEINFAIKKKKLHHPVK